MSKLHCLGGNFLGGALADPPIFGRPDQSRRRGAPQSRTQDGRNAARGRAGRTRRARGRPQIKIVWHEFETRRPRHQRKLNRGQLLSFPLGGDWRSNFPARKFERISARNSSIGVAQRESETSREGSFQRVKLRFERALRPLGLFVNKYPRTNTYEPWPRKLALRARETIAAQGRLASTTWSPTR
jgi:hypothetical protein